MRQKNGGESGIYPKYSSCFFRGSLAQIVAAACVRVRKRFPAVKKGLAPPWKMRSARWATFGGVARYTQSSRKNCIDSWESRLWKPDCCPLLRDRVRLPTAV